MTFAQCNEPCTDLGPARRPRILEERPQVELPLLAVDVLLLPGGVGGVGEVLVELGQRLLVLGVAAVDRPAARLDLRLLQTPELQLLKQLQHCLTPPDPRTPAPEAVRTLLDSSRPQNSSSWNS